MYKAIKAFLHDELGSVQKGQEFDATAAQIAPVKQFVEEYQTKVIGKAPETKAAKPSTKKAD